MDRHATMIPVAIVGMSSLLPDAVDIGSFWRNILAGHDCMREVPPSHWLIEDYHDPNPATPDKVYAKRGAFLPRVPFDPMAFGIPPNMLPSTDTAQLLALLVAKQVLDDASRGKLDQLDPERISVILGATGAQELMVEMGARLQRPVWSQALRELGYDEDEVDQACSRIESLYVPFVESTFPGLLGNVIAGRIANRFNLGGTNCVTDAACASAHAALSMGLQELALGLADLVITGGVDTMNDPSMFMCFSKTPALSPTGDCRPFSANADGTMLGEGLVMFALKRLADAERDNDRIYAVIRGLGTSSDGRALSVYAPRPEGQAKALRRAYAVAGYGPETVELMEAHGTGTKAGDVAEFSALARVFAETKRADKQWCALGSVKSQIGHTKSTAGAAGMAKAALALHHKVLPPTIKVTKPNAQLAIEESAFYLNTESRPWIRGEGHPRRASVSAFGFGGSNFHVTLEEYTGPAERAARTWTSPTELVLLGADSSATLAAACRNTAHALADDTNLNAFARRTQKDFSVHNRARVAIVATDVADLRRKLEQAAQKLAQNPDMPFSLPTGIFAGFGPRQGTTAFLFPGQGSQYPGMGADVAKSFDHARSAWDAAASLPLAHDARLHDVVFPLPAFDDGSNTQNASRLTATEWAQPAIGAASIALVRLLQSLHIEADVLGGHSFGELTALFMAGVLDAEAFLRAARKRGELMRDASTTPGAMMAVARPVDEVLAALKDAKIACGVANDNGPRQTVLSDTIDAIAAAEKVLQEKGFELRRLSVATAFHSPVVAVAREPFRAFLDALEMKIPAKPVYSNVTAKLHSDDVNEIRTQLADQIVSRVRFAEMIEGMYAAGVRTFVEVGPGSVLTNLVEQILGPRFSSTTVVNLDRKGQHGLTAFWNALGRLVAAGFEMNFDALWAGYALEPERPAPRPKFAVDINGANFGRPYPERKLDASKRPAPVPRPKAATVAPVEPAKSIASSPAAAPVAPAKSISSTPTAIMPTRAPTDMTSPPSVKIMSTPAAPMVNDTLLRSLGDAHAAMQRALSEGHANYLRAMESSFTSLCSAMGAPVAVAGPLANVHHIPAPAMSPAPVMAPPPITMAAPAPAIALQSAPLPNAAPPPAPIPPAPIPAAPIPPAPAASPAAKANTPDIHATLLDIVAEKTGYPKEMLDPAMSLEGDLGIDSIKRVEIFAGVRDRLSNLPALEPSKMASLRTLGQIIEHLRESAGASPSAVQSSAAPVAGPSIAAILTAIVAEKTGYPEEMLVPSMSLEGDLGIDSIKRVEILSALRERVPDLPNVTPSHMASLRTLEQIVNHLQQQTGERPSPAEPATNAVPTNPSPTIATTTKRAPDADTLARAVVLEIGAKARGVSLFGANNAARVVVTDDGLGVRALVVERLRRAGMDAHAADNVTANDHAVVFLGGLRPVQSPEDAFRISKEAFTIAHTVASGMTTRGGVFVTVQDTGGDFGLSGRAADRAWLAGLPGLVKTAALEWPTAAAKAIDIACETRSLEDIADAIVHELMAGGPEREVGLHADGTRTTLTAIPSPAPAGSLQLRPQSVLVVSGGARGVTIATLQELARAVPLRIVLLGRTELEDEPAYLKGVDGDAAIKRALLADAQRRNAPISPADMMRTVDRVLAMREARAGIASLEKLGSEVQYLAVDVRDQNAVDAALAKVRRTWGPITGIVHAAGILADKVLAEKTEEQFTRVFETKVKGLHSLLHATREDNLELLCVFSSVAARWGNMGQSDYALSNEIIGRVAAAERVKRQGHCVVRVLDWGPWDGGMVTPSLRSHFEARGVPLISLQGGARAFVRELSTGAAGDTEVVLGASLGLETPSGSDELAREFTVSPSAVPFLDSHRIEGRVVLPAVLVLDWFVQTAQELFPSLRVERCEDLRVLKGVLLAWDGRDERFRVVCRSMQRKETTTVLFLELMGQDNVRHYAGRVELANGLSSSQDADAPILVDAQAHEPDRATRAYGNTLFHGPHFRALHSLGPTSETGLTGTLRGARELAWTTPPSAVDTALLDGGLQMAIVWGHERLGARTLPTKIGSIRFQQLGWVSGSATAVLSVNAFDSLRMTSTLTWLDPDGKPIATMENLEMHVVPANSRAV